jgi:hypothetical protein
MKLFTWDLEGFEFAYSKYYYMPHLNNCVDGVDEDGHFHDTLRECGRASCICAFEDELITYSKLFFIQDPLFKTRTEKIINKLNIKAGSNIFVAGCAFGFLLEALSEKKMNVFGCDNSPYIHFNTDTESMFTIHNIDISDNNFHAVVLQETGVQYFDYVITEDVLTSYDNNGEPSINNILQNMKSILKVDKPLTNIINIVDVNCGGPFNKKPLNEWKEINPNHTWLNFDGDDF